jgi:hypothetical protein
MYGDTKGALPVGFFGNRWFCAIVDDCTGYIEAWTMPHKEAQVCTYTVTSRLYDECVFMHSIYNWDFKLMYVADMMFGAVFCILTMELSTRTVR